MFKKSKCLLFSFALFVGALMFSVTAFAEDVTGCKGAITGVAENANGNSGDLDFDSHPIVGDGVGGVLTDLGIIDEGWGYAPADSEYAACLEETAIESIYDIKGFSWDTNLGFFSYYCSGGANGENLGIDCGEYSYGVEARLGPGGNGKLYGYAWNPAFGWVNFQCVDGDNGFDDADCGGIDYGVDVDGDGNLSGCAYSQANVYVCYDGVQIHPDYDPLIGDSWCTTHDWDGVCVEVNVSDGPMVADGREGYEMEVYLRENSVYLSKEDYNVQLNLSYEDTVVLNQVSRERELSAATYPTVITNSDLVDLDSPEVGHYKVSVDGDEEVIRSYAPTHDGNFSWTTSTLPAYKFLNELFLVGAADLIKSPNNLEIESINYRLSPTGDAFGDSEEGTIYANGKVGLSLPFKPLLEADVLYANDEQDSIKAYRSVPVNIRMGLAENSDASYSDSAVDVVLTQAETGGACGEEDGFYEVGFDFKFVNEDASELNFVDSEVSGLIASDSDYPVIGELEEGMEGKTCSFVQQPGIYTVVSYVIDGKRVEYYSNKLPRLTEAASNPGIEVHGNIYSQFSCQVSADLDAISPIGDQTVKAVRDTIDRNIKTLLKFTGSGRADDNCSIDKFGDSPGCTPDASHAIENAFGRTEKILYYKDKDVYIGDFGAEAGDVAFDVADRDYALIVDGGNLYINDNIWDADKQVAIAVLRGTDQDFMEGGNVFVSPYVNNIRASVIADGAVFTDSSLEIDREDDENGDFSEFFQNLIGESYQLLWEGGISSRNTIGGAEICGERTTYFFRGNEPTTNKQAAQLYDLNYLRLFRLDLELKNGLPVDQQCKKALTVEDIIAIYNGELIFGPDYDLCDGIDPFHAYNLDDAYAEDSGDLVPLASEEKLVPEDRKPDAVRYNPVYIYYEDSDSFLFRAD